MAIPRFLPASLGLLLLIATSSCKKEPAPAPTYPLTGSWSKTHVETKDYDTKGRLLSTGRTVAVNSPQTYTFTDDTLTITGPMVNNAYTYTIYTPSNSSNRALYLVPVTPDPIAFSQQVIQLSETNLTLETTQMIRVDGTTTTYFHLKRL